MPHNAYDTASYRSVKSLTSHMLTLYVA